MDSSYSTSRLTLRELTTDDGPSVHGILSEIEVAKQTRSLPHPFPDGLALDIVGSWIKMKKEGTATWFAVIVKATNEIAGVTGLNFQNEHKKAEIGYLFGKPYWGKGYATEAAKKIVELGFKDYDINKIWGMVYADNPNSIKVLEKIGMKHEGTIRKDLIKFGQARDVAYYGLLREECGGEKIQKVEDQKL